MLGRNTFDALKRVSKPADHFKLLSSSFIESDSHIAATLRTQNVTLACKAGCTFCCFLKVDVSPQEVFYIIDYLEKKRSEELPAIKARSAKHFEAILPLTFREHLGSNHLCPLNLNGSCLAYDVRPFACRIFHAQTVETCEYSHENPTELESPSSQNSTMEAIGKAASFGVSSAYKETGYDSNTYDLGAALHGAFTNPKAFKRWRDKKTAFPPDCRVKQPKHGQ